MSGDNPFTKSASVVRGVGLGRGGSFKQPVHTIISRSAIRFVGDFD